MNSKLLDEIPSLDLQQFRDSSTKNDFVKQLGEGFASIGFVAVKNHHLTNQMIDKLYSDFESFFSLEDAVKLKYYSPELHGQRGYVPKRQENAKGSLKPDLKEFYHIGQTADNLQSADLDYPSNIWPLEVKSLEASASSAFNALEKTGLEILEAIAIYLNLPTDYFVDKVTEGNSILRAIHYFPLQAEDVKDGSVRAGAHGDINLITLLMGASAEGLEVQRIDGKWIPITALPDQLIINVADMLERLTNGVLKSTIHRVVNPPVKDLGTSRYSMPFFMHPKSSMDLSCLPSCVSDTNPKCYEDISAGDFLLERLREIGLIK